MTALISAGLPYVVLFSHIVFVFLLFSLFFANAWGRNIAYWLGSHAIAFSFLVSLAAVLGSLFYSEIMGFEPCVLCWWQRVLLFPLVIIFGVALWKKNKSAFLYAVPLALAVALIAAYHSYTYLGGRSFLDCTALGGACSKIYVMAFGYITIPFMSLTVALYILLLAWARGTYEKDHPHS